MSLLGIWSRLSLYYNTVKFLKPIQFTDRLKRKIFRPQIHNIPEKAMPTASPDGRLPGLIFGPSQFYDDGTVKFLNISDDFKKYRWGEYPQTLLWTYNLHYFDDLKSREMSSLQHEMIESWVEEVPQGEGPAWSPYPTSLRVVNWIFWHLRQKETGKSGLSDAALSSLRVQLDYLSQNIEWHLLGNHLFENGKALLIGGMFFSGERADQFLAKGIKIVTKEIEEQILTDGAHFELSPMYHALFVEGLLQILMLERVFSYRKNDAFYALSNQICTKLPAMLQWLKNMLHPDGDISFFNDSAFGISPSFASLAELAAKFALSPKSDNSKFSSLGQSGYFRMALQDSTIILDFADIGPRYLPGHGHADTLSFEWSLGTQRVFVNSGTSTYQHSELRAFQRSTSAHNTVAIGKEDSSEVWGSFRVARRAKVFSASVNNDLNGITAQASHDGYHRLSPPVTHHRMIRLEPNQLQIADTLNRQINSVVRYFLHPNCRAEYAGENKIIISVDDNATKISMIVDGARVRIKNSFWYPEFNMRYRNQLIELIPTGRISITKLHWQN